MGVLWASWQMFKQMNLKGPCEKYCGGKEAWILHVLIKRKRKEENKKYSFHYPSFIDTTSLRVAGGAGASPSSHGAQDEGWHTHTPFRPGVNIRPEWSDHKWWALSKCERTQIHLQCFLRSDHIMVRTRRIHPLLKTCYSLKMTLRSHILICFFSLYQHWPTHAFM